ncbi:uncharacterized protein LOC110812015 isoform X2 [Carica papaya]|uniref:uncharacterized protein LOC110812015 isoform X2 n=1 Tax=Carica papaya TaxID=3649 RepID=UPI000B8CFD50|nr:uncharacterized protein LOC110812015 isoform X2 [Carica papaya]
MIGNARMISGLYLLQADTSRGQTQNEVSQGTERPAPLLDEYHLRENADKMAFLSSEHLSKEEQALDSTSEELNDSQLLKDGKLILDFLQAIHAAEQRQAELDAHVFSEEKRVLKEKYENELRDLRARELMRIEEAAILDKKRSKAACRFFMFDMLFLSCLLKIQVDVLFTAFIITSISS